MTKIKSNHFIIDTRDAINHSTLRTFLSEILLAAQQLGLSCTKVINYTQVGEFISIGTSEDADIDLIRRAGYICEQGYQPVLNVVEDFNEIKKRLLNYAIGFSNKPTELYCGGDITFHRGFIKIDTEEESIIVKNTELMQLAAQAVQLNLWK